MECLVINVVINARRAKRVANTLTEIGLNSSLIPSDNIQQSALFSNTGNHHLQCMAPPSIALRSCDISLLYKHKTRSTDEDPTLGRDNVLGFGHHACSCGTLHDVSGGQDARHKSNLRRASKFPIGSANAIGYPTGTPAITGTLCNLGTFWNPSKSIQRSCARCDQPVGRS